MSLHPVSPSFTKLAIRIPLLDNSRPHEANSGLPLSGGRVAFPRELIERRRGGGLTPRDHVKAPAEAVETLARDTAVLRVRFKMV